MYQVGVQGRKKEVVPHEMMTLAAPALSSPVPPLLQEVVAR